VEVLLEGAFERSFLSPDDNSQVVATDTCKNHVYITSKEVDFVNIEQFGLALAEKMLRLYEHVDKVSIGVVERPWRRAQLQGKNSSQTREHSHSFEGDPSYRRTARVIGTRDSTHRKEVSFQVTSGIKNWTVLKTTGSGFVNFYKDKFTVLPEVKDRLFGTTAVIQWTHKASTSFEFSRFDVIFDGIRRIFLETFADEYSPSVQRTAFLSGERIMKEFANDIEEISFQLPNLHNWVFDLERFGLKNKDQHSEVYFPTDKPHGTIRVVIGPSAKAKL